MNCARKETDAVLQMPAQNLVPPFTYVDEHFLNSISFFFYYIPVQMYTASHEQQLHGAA